MLAQVCKHTLRIDLVCCQAVKLSYRKEQRRLSIGVFDLRNAFA